MATGSSVPFEKQEATETCGAAALCMVYRSFDAPVPQANVWSHISQTDDGGQASAHTHLMCQDAIRRGYSALIVRAMDPWRMLQLCEQNGIRVVLNHRSTLSSSRGHYTVLVVLDGEHAIVHDPEFGGQRRIAREDLLRMWQPDGPDSEITGNIMILLSNGPAAPTVLPDGSVGVPLPIQCSCQNPAGIVLQPVVPLGSLQRVSQARTWESIFCPYCDREWAEVAGLPTLAVAPASPGSPGSEGAETLDELRKLEALHAALGDGAKPPPPATMAELAALFKEPPLAHLEPLPGHLDQMLGFFEQAITEAPTPDYRDAMKSIVTQLRDLGPKFIAECRKTMIESTASIRESLAEIEATEKEIAKVQAMRAEAEKAAAAALAQPKPPKTRTIDPELGAKLRMQLLGERCKLGATTKAKPAEAEYDFRDWVDRSLGGFLHISKAGSESPPPAPTSAASEDHSRPSVRDILSKRLASALARHEAADEPLPRATSPTPTGEHDTGWWQWLQRSKSMVEPPQEAPSVRMDDRSLGIRMPEGKSDPDSGWWQWLQKSRAEGASKDE